MKWLKDYFDLSRKEEAGMLALISLIIILFILQFLWIYIIPKHNEPISYKSQFLDSLGTKNKVSNSSNTDSDQIQKSALFNFDPNKLDEQGFIKLGFTDAVALHIIHYREKGGHFYTPADLKKIYGLSDNDFDRLEPYISISNAGKEPGNVLVDLNKADSLQLLFVRGIGPVFASRILFMRKSLGGFVNKNQLMDIYGIDPKRYESIKDQVYLSKHKIHSLNINTATAETLQQNPYIKYKMAKIIVQYRETHGMFKTVEDLKNIYAIDAKVFEKMKPYLTVD